MNNRIHRFTNALMSFGIKKGDHVIILFHYWIMEITFAAKNNKRKNYKWETTTKALRT